MAYDEKETYRRIESVILQILAAYYEAEGIHYSSHVSDTEMASCNIEHEPYIFSYEYNIH